MPHNIWGDLVGHFEWCSHGWFETKRLKYNMILHISLQWPGKSINQRLNPQNTSHSSPLRASYGMYFVVSISVWWIRKGMYLVRIWEKIDRVIMAPYCFYLLSQKCVCWWPSTVMCWGICRHSDKQICVPLHWRHNGLNSISNHQPHHCLLNRLFRHRSKKISKLRISGFCAGNSPVNSPHKWPVTREMSPFDDIIMLYTYGTSTSRALDHF